MLGSLHQRPHFLLTRKIVCGQSYTSIVAINAKQPVGGARTVPQRERENLISLFRHALGDVDPSMAERKETGM